MALPPPDRPKRTPKRLKPVATGSRGDSGRGVDKPRRPNKPKAAGPPKYTEQIPVRPGAPTPRPGHNPHPGGRPSTQAQRTHVHKVRAARGRLIKKKPNFPTNTKPLEHLPEGVPESQRDLYLKDPKKLKAAGFKIESGLDKVGPGIHDKVAPGIHAAAGATLSATSFALEQLARPSSALGAAQLDRSAKGGSSVGSRAKAAWGGFKHPGEHSGDWVKAARKQGWPAPLITGTAASIAADPTTYLTGGVATPAKALAMHTFEKTLAETGDHLAATTAARKAWEKAPAHTKVPGVKVGVRGTPARVANRSLSGRPVTTGAMGGRVLSAAKRGGDKTGVKHVPVVGKVVSGTAGGGRTLLNKFAPGVRPKGWHPVDWDIARRAATTARAAERGAGRKGLARLEAYRKATKGWSAERHAKVIHAIEADDLSNLTPTEHAVALAAQNELAHIAGKERAAGILSPHVEGTRLGGLKAGDKGYEDAPAGYWPRTPSPESKLKVGGARPGSGKITQHGRKELRRLKHLDPEQQARYTMTVPESMSRRVQAHERKMGAAGLNERIAGLGEKVSVAAEDVKGLAGTKRDDLFAHTPEGLRPLFNKHGLVDGEKLGGAVKAGHQIVAVDPQQAEAVRYMASGQRGAKDAVDHLGLGGTPGEQTNPLGKLQRKWKFAVTAPNLAYHVRNAIGDLYNARLADVGVGDVKAAGRLRHVESKLAKAEKELHTLDPAAAKGLAKARAHVEDYGGRKMSDAEVVILAQEHGAVKTGYVGAELRKTYEGGKRGVGARGADAIARASEWREDIVRLATFRSGLKAGMSPEQAARHSLDHHFDYSELSKAEQTWLRNVFPFYTWTARNLPLQVKSLAKRPGVVANTDKVRKASLQVAGMPANATSTQPSYQQESPQWGTPFKVGADDAGRKVKLPVTLNPNLPISSLGMVPPVWLGRREGGREALQNVAQMLSPGIKLPTEALTGKNPATGAKIKDRVQAPSLPGVGTILGGHKIKDERTGKMVPSWPGWATELASQTPYTGQVARAGTTSKTGQPENEWMRLANLLGAPGARGQDARTARISQLYRENEKLQNQHDDLAQRDPHHVKGEHWEKGSPVWRINQKIAKNTKAIDTLTAHIQGKPAPKKKKLRRKSVFDAPTTGKSVFDTAPGVKSVFDHP